MSPVASSTSSSAERILKRSLAAVAALSLTLAVACGGDDKPSDSVVVATAGPATSATQSSAGSDKPPTSPPAPSQAVNASNEPLSFGTSDGVTIKGHFYSAPGPKRRALIIASTSDQKALGAQAAPFVAQGIAVYTYDARGVGETGGARSDAALERDLGVAVGLIKSRDYPLVYVFGVGNEAGDAAVKVAAREQLAGVATYGAGSTGTARRITTSGTASVADPLSAADARQSLLDFVLGR